MVSSSLVRPLQLANRAMQWISAVIVMSITSYFINRNPHGEHIIYQEVISTMSVAFFLLGFISPFLPKVLSKIVLGLDIIFSYLWLTAFIFAAQDYNWHNCYANAPPNIGCSRKKANEAFIFLAFFFTFTAIFLEIAGLWADRDSVPTREKGNGHEGAATA